MVEGDTIKNKKHGRREYHKKKNMVEGDTIRNKNMVEVDTIRNTIW